MHKPGAGRNRVSRVKSGTDSISGKFAILNGDGTGRCVNGEGGLQATSRNYLFTPDSAATSMTDVVPTEASLYPENWGTAHMK